uniref:Uncharacterized protein n=1 Tax=viral metagenome TaxID=1070528 RepID=A0A6H1ZYW9_9ZZZZ
MAKTTGQYIPPEDKHLYEAALEVARPDGSVRKAYPKQIPATATSIQIPCRYQFKLCADIFLSQPDLEQAAWLEAWETYQWADRAWGPLVGPRGRAWWYGQAAIHSKWYYTYYIELTLQSLYANIYPDWIKLSTWQSFLWTRLVWD